MLEPNPTLHVATGEEEIWLLYPRQVGVQFPREGSQRGAHLAEAALCSSSCPARRGAIRMLICAIIHPFT